MRRLLNDMLWLLLPFAVLLALNIAGAGLPTAPLLAVWLLLTAVMFAGLWTRAVSRRHAFLSAYMHAGSVWRRRWRGGPLLAVAQLVQAALLALVLLVAVVRLDDTVAWRLLLVGLPLLVLLHGLLRRWMVPHVSPLYLPELSWRLTLRLNFVLMLPALALAALYVSYPALAEVTLKQAIWNEMTRQEATSQALLGLMQVAAAKDALGWWLGQQLLPGLGEPLFQLGGWLLLLAAEGLFLWSYLVLVAGMLDLVHWRRRPPLPTLASAVENSGSAVGERG